MGTDPTFSSRLRSGHVSDSLWVVSTERVEFSGQEGGGCLHCVCLKMILSLVILI